MHEDQVLAAMRARNKGRKKPSPTDIKKARDALVGAFLRSATDLLEALGDPECPLDTTPDPKLLREVRLALGYSQKELAWRIGSPVKSPSRISQAEAGKRTLTRAERLLLRVELRKLDGKQRALMLDLKTRFKASRR